MIDQKLAKKNYLLSLEIIKRECGEDNLKYATTL
jgi:hypothetical protein